MSVCFDSSRVVRFVLTAVFSRSQPSTRAWCACGRASTARSGSPRPGSGRRPTARRAAPPSRRSKLLGDCNIRAKETQHTTTLPSRGCDSTPVLVSHSLALRPCPRFCRSRPPLRAAATSGSTQETSLQRHAQTYSVSLVRKCTLLGPYRSLCLGSEGDDSFFMSEAPLYRDVSTSRH